MAHSMGVAAMVEVAAARRLLRARWWRPALAACVIAVAMPVAAFVTLSAFSLTRADVQDRDFGRFDARVISGTPIPPGPSSRLRDFTGLQGEGSALELISLEMRTTADPEVPLTYRETDWTTEPYPWLSLEKGRWPSAPGEVVISDSLTSKNGKVSVLSGRAAFTVVGTASSRFSDDKVVYAAPGSWEGLPRDAGQARDNLTAEASLLLEASAVTRVQSQSDQTVTGGLLLRRSEAQAETSWVLESPLSFLVPASLLPFLAGCLAQAIVGARRRSFVDRAVGLGMRPRRAALVSVAPVIVMSVPGLVVGVAAGLAVGFAGRWAGAAVAQQQSSLPSLWTPVAVVAASLLLGLLVTGLWAAKTANRQQPVRPSSPAGGSTPRLTGLRRGVALLLAGGSVFVLSRVSDGQSAMVFAAGLLLTLLLMIPEVVVLVAGLLRTGRPDQRLARRLLTSPDRGYILGTAFAAVLLTLPLVTAVLSTATGGLQRSEALAEVGEGQLGLNGRGGVGDAPAARVAAIVDDVLGDQRSVQVRPARNAWYDTLEGNALVFVVTTPDDVERVWGRPLSAAQQQALNAGGALVWQPGAPLLVDEQPVEVRTSEYLPSPEWATQSGAVTLEEPARKLGIKTRPGRIVYLDVSASQAQDAREQVASAGLDPSQVAAYHSPTPLLPPAPLVASTVLLFVALVASLALATRANAKELERLFNRMIMIGSSPQFTRRTFLTVTACTFVVAAAIAVLVTVGCILALRAGAPSIELNLSWPVMLGGLTAALLAVWSGARFGLRRLPGY